MDQYLGEIRLVGFSYAPQGWAFCAGQLLPINQNTALYSLLGTYYGGNGTSTFALPNLQGKIPIGTGQGPGTSNYVLGQTGGVSSVTLDLTQIAAHGHTLPATNSNGSPSNAPVPGVILGGAGGRTGGNPFYVDATTQSTSSVTMASSIAQAAGNGQPHNNMGSYVALNYIIALLGIYPSRP